MRRTLIGLASITTAVVLASSQPALATSTFPGAGWVVKGVSTMQTVFTVPAARCSHGENSAVVVGLQGPDVGGLDGWNAAAVVGCANGQRWSRIQTWVNAVGGGHKVYDASPGDVIRAAIVNATSAHPLIAATDLTTGHGISYRLTKRATTVAAGGYAGVRVPAFPHADMVVWANSRPLVQLSRVKRYQYRGSTKLMAPGGAWGARGEIFSLYYWHH